MNPKIEKLIQIASSVEGRAQARAKAKTISAEFPHNGCGAMLSALLLLADIDVNPSAWAQTVVDQLEARGWDRIPVGKQVAGDVGVTVDANLNGATDHVYVVLSTQGGDKMTIVDNQSRDAHSRYASGRGKGRTVYFLRGG